MLSLKQKRYFDEIYVTGCTGNCHFDNLRCSQWRTFRQNDSISVSVMGTLKHDANLTISDADIAEKVVIMTILNSWVSMCLTKHYMRWIVYLGWTKNVHHCGFWKQLLNEHTFFAIFTFQLWTCFNITWLQVSSVNGIQCLTVYMYDNYGFLQDCSNSIVNALELL